MQVAARNEAAFDLALATWLNRALRWGEDHANLRRIFVTKLTTTE